MGHRSLSCRQTLAQVQGVDAPHVPKGAAKTLRGTGQAPGEPGEFYVLLGPIGYEKEEVVLAHWNANIAQLLS